MGTGHGTSLGGTGRGGSSCCAAASEGDAFVAPKRSSRFTSVVCGCAFAFARGFLGCVRLLALIHCRRRSINGEMRKNFPPNSAAGVRGFLLVGRSESLNHSIRWSAITHGNLVASHWFHDSLFAHAGDNIESNPLLTHRELHVIRVVLAEERRAVKSSLLAYLAHCTIALRLVLVDFAAGESPRRLCTPSLDENTLSACTHLCPVLVEQDCTAYRHACFVLNKTGIRSFETLLAARTSVNLDERHDICGNTEKLARKAAQVPLRQRLVVGAHKIQIKPMRLLDLETDSLNACQFTRGEVHDEPATEVFKDLCKRLCSPDLCGIITHCAGMRFGCHGSCDVGLR